MRLGDRHRQPVHARAGACSPSTAAALADAVGGRFVLGLGSSSNVIVERWNGVPFEKPLTQRARGDRGAAAGARRRARAGGFKLETPPAQPVPIVVAALRGKMLALGRRARRRRVHQLPAAVGAEHVSRGSREGERRRARASELVCRFFCVPRRAEEGLGARALPVRRLRDRAGLRGVLPLARLGRAIDPMVEAWHAATASARSSSRPRTSCARSSSSAARRAARAPGRVRRRRHHDAGPHADRRARAAAGADRRAGALSLERIWPDRAPVTADELVGEAARA